MATVEIVDVRSEYVRLVDELRKSFKASRAKTLAILASTTCEVLAAHQIANRESEDVRFDAYYLEKLELAKQNEASRQR